MKNSFFFKTVQCALKKSIYYAKCLNSAMIGMGTRDQDLIRLIVSRCEKDLGAIKQDFEFLYKKSLTTVVAVSDQMMNASKISLIESIKQHS